MNYVTASDLLRIYRTQDEDMIERINVAVELVNKTANPRKVIAEYEANENFTLSDVTLIGNDIKKHLSDSTSVIIGVCTLGQEVDRLIEKLKITDLSKAVLVDLAASLAAENYTHSVWTDICSDAEAKGLKCTSRYSCGYGDFDLMQQKDILRISGADRSLGILVDDGGLMYPTKSVTFLCGLKT